jgi:hypothetical protein
MACLKPEAEIRLADLPTAGTLEGLLDWGEPVGVSLGFILEAEVAYP